MNHFKGKQFQKDVIIVAVGYYLRYNLSYREVQELLYDRGINVCHTTIYRWVQEYSKVLYDLWKKKNRQSFYSWKMDETSIKIKGRWHYLYGAIDADGLTLDIWLRKKRDTQAAYAFLKRLHKQFGEPKAILSLILFLFVVLNGSFKQEKSDKEVGNNLSQNLGKPTAYELT